uniref:C2 calcium dependent domain containing 4A n=1 Tax=Neogobius melanostomus TaxID=47308 RepID=A0A8C6T4A0_9GOBI
MWVVEKLRESRHHVWREGRQAQMDFLVSQCHHSDNIPEFCIPPTIPSLHHNLENVRVQRNVQPTPKITLEPTHYELSNPHIIQVESVDESPGDACSDEETTNADPQSQAALSLPHLARTQTCYGFCTLLESPHTRRKESIFHSDSTSPLNHLSSRLSPRSFHWQHALDSDTTSSTESSPFSSPLLNRYPKSSLFKVLSHELLLNNSLSTDEGSSTDNSPNIMRRGSEVLSERPSSCSLAPPAVFPLDLSLHQERLMKEKMIPIGKDGSLRLFAEYCPDNLRLRVRLISAEGLYPLSVDPKIINCSVSLNLVPGKVQKQRSTVIRKSRNPIFNEDFFFDGITEEDLEQRSLRFKVVNKMSTLKETICLPLIYRYSILHKLIPYIFSKKTYFCI